MLKPSDVGKKRVHRYTKRRLLKTLAAAGFSIGTVANITTNDVEAAANDQVVISLDFAGKEKRYISSDWYDRLVHTRRVHQKMMDNWMDHRDVLAVDYHAGQKGENPGIEIILDHNSRSKEETRGEVPEEKEGVPIEVREGDYPERHACKGCDNYDFSAELDTHVPGSAMIEVWKDDSPSFRGTLSPMIIDNSGTYHGQFMTAAHNVCPRLVDKVFTSHGSCNGTRRIGWVAETYPRNDFAIIATDDNTYALDEVAENTDFTNGKRFEMAGTLNQDGVDTVANNNTKVFKYGYGTCVSQGVIKAQGSQQSRGSPEDCVSDSSWTQYNVIKWGDDGDSNNGDSGAVVFTTPQGTRKYYGVLLNQGSSGLFQDRIGASYAFGVAGHHLRNKFGYHWGDGGGGNESP